MSDPSSMRGLTLTQPWASLVAIGAKRIETRSWSTNYRGPIAIHAAKGFPKECQRLACDAALYREPLVAAGMDVYTPPPEHWYHAPSYHYRGGLPLGAIVATARLAYVFMTGDTLNYEHDVRTKRGPNGLTYEMTPQEIAFGNYEPGRYGWVLTDVQRLPEPIPCKGALGLWTVPAEIVAQLKGQAYV